MSEAIQEKRVKENEFPLALGDILEREEYKMTFQDVLVERETKVRKDLAKEMLIDGEDIVKIVKYTKLTEAEVLEIRSELNKPDVKAIEKRNKDLAKAMLIDKKSIDEIVKYSTLKEDEVLRILSELNLPDAI